MGPERLVAADRQGVETGHRKRAVAFPAGGRGLAAVDRLAPGVIGGHTQRTIVEGGPVESCIRTVRRYSDKAGSGIGVKLRR